MFVREFPRNPSQAEHPPLTKPAYVPVKEHAAKIRLFKRPYQPMKLLDIQSMLARDYNFMKWDLIETMELHHRLLRLQGFFQGCRDLLMTLYNEKLSKTVQIKLRPTTMTNAEVLEHLELTQPLLPGINLVEQYQHDLAC
jgi:hypothetical protein